MDRATLSAYDTAAADFANDWHEQPPPADLHALVNRFFTKGITADIGCGSGREVAWLAANGYPAIGYDVSQGLLVEARHRYPDGRFEFAALPELTGIASGTFDNVLSETVIMHLPLSDIGPSVRRLIEILKPRGILYLSWRVMRDADQRDKSERLYSAFPADLVRDELRNTTILLDEEVVSASSSKTIHRIVARR
ncbi:MAG TPA: class I SAM-dependent methyltransferase [Pseudolabrys sp.]